jgi:anthranilate phosphoribosyltransferase
VKYFLEKLYHHHALNADEAKNILVKISEGNVPPAQLASFMTVYLMRPITTDELRGFKNALLELCLPFRCDHDSIDLCGTGGDGKNTFNISTLASFVVASCGAKVTKHGNYGVSSISGSSTVLEEFGCSFTTSQDILQKQLEKSNICFLHAPLFHPALKQVADVRKELGIRTFFNMLGPLANPAQPRYRFTGVFSNELARSYSYLLQEEKTSYTIVHSSDGHDEISCTDSFKILSNDGEKLLRPADLDLSIYGKEELFGGNTKKEAAGIFLKILRGKGTPAQTNVVSVNAAFALNCATGKTITECLELSKASLLSGAAYSTFNNFISLSS